MLFLYNKIIARLFILYKEIIFTSRNNFYEIKINAIKYYMIFDKFSKLYMQ